MYIFTHLILELRVRAVSSISIFTTSRYHEWADGVVVLGKDY